MNNTTEVLLSVVTGLSSLSNILSSVAVFSTFCIGLVVWCRSGKKPEINTAALTELKVLA